MKAMKYIYTIVFCFIGMTLVQAQCCQDRHSTNAHDGWISCSTSPNPISALGNTHWIRYDLGQTQQLYSSTFWNLNDPDRLPDNIKSARIDYSANGSTWSYWGTMSFVIANGKPKYEGFAGPDFNGISARYLLITPMQNFGGSCFGFSEMRIYTEPGNAGNFALNLNPCINDGVIYGLNGGIERGGNYSGVGIVNNYEDKFDFDPDAAGPGSHTITYQYQENGNLVSHTATINVRDCGTAGCGPCPPCQYAFQPTLDGNPILNGTYYDAPQLESAGSVNQAFNIDYRGSEAVLLNQGFNVELNAVFEAQIRKCTEGNMLLNGDFESGSVEPWIMEIHDVAAADLSLETNSTHVYNGTASAKVVTTSTTATSWHIQFEQFGPSISNGKPYILTRKT